MNSRLMLYFLLAALPTFFGVAVPPSNAWDWAKLIGMTIYQGLLAVKAYQSPQPPDKPVLVTTPPNQPLPVIETPKP